jgi:hypothetical protein
MGFAGGYLNARGATGGLSVGDGLKTAFLRRYSPRLRGLMKHVDTSYVFNR